MLSGFVSTFSTKKQRGALEEKKVCSFLSLTVTSWDVLTHRCPKSTAVGLLKGKKSQVIQTEAESGTQICGDRTEARANFEFSSLLFVWV